MLFKVILGVVPALAQAGFAHGEPAAGLLHQAQLDTQVQQFPFLGDALAVHDIKFGLPEGGRHLVFDYLGPGVVANELVAHFEGLHLADVDADRGVELQRPTAGGDLRVAVGNADFLPELVDKDHDTVGLCDAAGQLPQGLAHEPGVDAHKALAHLSFDLGPGDQRCHRVHHDHVHGAGADQLFRDFQALLTGVWLGNEHGVDVHPQSLGVNGVQGVFRVDVGHLAAQLLCFGHDVQGQGGFARGFGPVNFHDPAPGDAADAQGDIQGQGAGGHRVNLDGGAIAHTHNGAFAVGPFDLGQGGGQGFFLVAGRGGRGLGLRNSFLACHSDSSFIQSAPDGVVRGWPRRHGGCRCSRGDR